nr:MAG TPA: cell division protein [Caudoviricetes sp.]
MYKDIMISLLGAWILRDAFGTTEVREQIAIVMGLAAVLFIFLLFLENQVEKWREYRQRVRDLEQRLGQLRGGGKCERRESAGDYGKTGADTVTAVDDAG